MANEAQNAWGLPPINEYSPLVQQGYQDTCAIRSQQLILNDFGIPVTEDELVQVAVNNDWYTPGGGTSPDDANKLLEYFNVDTNVVQNANIFSLTNELAQGHRVIVGVDSGELWEPGLDENLEDLYGEIPDHALIVAGIDTTDPDHTTVHLMDPGTGQISASYPLDQFMDAWSDSNCMMISTVEPPPSFAFGMDNFDYSYLHIPFVGEMPYSEFDRFVNYNDFCSWNPGDLEINSLSPEMVGEQEAYWDKYYADYSQNLMECIQGETTVPQMLENVFEDQIPNINDFPFSESVLAELDTTLGLDDDLSLAVTHFQEDSDWMDHYSSLSQLHATNGNSDMADWYANQFSDESGEFNC